MDMWTIVRICCSKEQNCTIYVDTDYDSAANEMQLLSLKSYEIM